MSYQWSFLALTVGMLGTPGRRIDMMSCHDGKILMSDIDVNAYGEESWQQVKDTDVQLFQEALGPQCLEKCL